MRPADISFVRQGVQRIVFEETQSIPLAVFNPASILGLEAMHPVQHRRNDKAKVDVSDERLSVIAEGATETSLWFGGFNPFATYSIDIDSCIGNGITGFEFSDASNEESLRIGLLFEEEQLKDVLMTIQRQEQPVIKKSIRIPVQEAVSMSGTYIVQMQGSGLVVFKKDKALPKVVAQGDFSNDLELRNKKRIHSFQSRLLFTLENASVKIVKASMALSAGMGLADIRAITYENGDPFLDMGRIWYTMTIRGRGLPHPVQGVFSMHPSVFDIRLEGYILFDRNDGLLRNEVASHIYYDRHDKMWRGITTGFSAYATPAKEKKQLLSVESKSDPRFGFSVMKASPFGMVGDIEDPHIVYDAKAKKWRILTCENTGDGYKAVILESGHWNKGYQKIAGPVNENSTGTSIQKVDGIYYCFSGSADRKIFIYTYPDLKNAGILQMDLPPWSADVGTRVWPNVVQLPEGYSSRFIALMMDRFNYPGITGPNWTYGALYLYHGN